MITRNELNKINQCSQLLPEPSPKIIQDLALQTFLLLDKITELEQQLREESTELEQRLAAIYETFKYFCDLRKYIEDDYRCTDVPFTIDCTAGTCPLLKKGK